MNLGGTANFISKRSATHEQLWESNAMGMLRSCVGVFPRKEGRIQLLAGLVPSTQTVGSLFRVIHEQAKRRKSKNSTASSLSIQLGSFLFTFIYFYLLLFTFIYSYLYSHL